jgi:ubiquinone/menaquinone biosynthesis C-methylase UbiE
VEVGSGTGAGAHLIAGSLLPGAHYYALDMQAASTATCNRRHTSERPTDGTLGTANVTCVHVPKGVGNHQPIVDNHGKPLADKSVDVVIICETHIAATKIGREEDAIFAEIHRVLAPGGLFVWGNALPTKVWKAAPIALTQHGFKQILSSNVTKGAVEARDLDAPRVNAFMDSWGEALWVMSIFGVHSTCGEALAMLVKNFYRHPGTALYNTMVNGHDSYMRQVYQKPRRHVDNKHGHDSAKKRRLGEEDAKHNHTR